MKRGAVGASQSAGRSDGRPQVRDVPCKFWMEGRCERGESCQFKHPAQQYSQPYTVEPPAKRSKGGGGRGGEKGSSAHLDPSYTAAFKVLFPDAFVSCVIGAAGATRIQIEEECGAHVQISSRDCFYPGTKCRKLIVRAENNQNIMQVLHTMVDKIEDRVLQDEAKGKGRGSGKDEQEHETLYGKEPGEYVFRICLPTVCTGRLLGPAGANIKQLREETGAKIFVDNEKYSDHQLVRLIGLPDNVRAALQEIVTIVETELSEDQLADWAPAMVVTDQGDTHNVPKGSKGGKDKGKGKDKDKGKGKGGLRPRGKGKGDGGGDAANNAADDFGEAEPEEFADGVDEEEDPEDRPPCPATLDEMKGIADDFAPGTLDMLYEISCELPKDNINALIGRNGEHLKSIKEATGAKVTFSQENHDSDNRTMSITGELVGVYQAHMMMMRKYHESDQILQAEREEEEKKRAEEEEKRAEEEAAAAEELAGKAEKVSELQAQMALLQAQMAEIAGDAGGGKASGKSKGKGKRK